MSENVNIPSDAELREMSREELVELGGKIDGVDTVFLLSPHGFDMADLQLGVIRQLRRSGARIVKHCPVVVCCPQRLEFDIAKAARKNISNGLLVTAIHRAGKLPDAGVTAEAVAGTQQTQAITQRARRAALSCRNRRAN